MLLSAQGVSYTSDCLQRLKERVASSSLDSALKTVASRLSYVKSEPIIVTIKGERKFFLMEPLAEGSFFKLNSNRHDGAGFCAEHNPKAIVGQALTCYSYCQFTDCKAMCTDLQGKGDLLFDPAWVTRLDPAVESLPFGLGNVGNLTMKKFFEQHVHEENAVCEMLGHVTPSPASFLFANLQFVVDLEDKSMARKVKQTIEEYGGTVSRLPSGKSKLPFV